VTQLTLAIAGVRLFALARAAFRYGERYVTHLATFRILTRLRVWFYQAIESLAPAGLQAYRSGDLLARIVADIETLENFYVRVIVPPFAAALVTLLACAILGSFDPRLALALLVFLLLTGVGLPLASRWLSRQPAAELVATRAELNATLVDQVQGLPELLAYDLQQEHLLRAARLGQELGRLQERLAMVRGLGNGLAALFTSLAGLTVLLLAIPLVTSGQIEGVYLALLPLTAIASFEAVQPLSQAFQVLESSRAAARRLFDLAAAPPAVQDPPGPSPQPGDMGLELRSLTFRYPADPSGAAVPEPVVLENLSFSVPSGSHLALIGPSGAGKSTLVNLLLRFWDFRDGQILLGGHDLRTYHAADVRALIGVVPQHPYLFNTSVRDNLLLANPDASQEDLAAACRQAEIHDFILGLPEGYDTLVGENGVLLSGGERQRLAIARAILKDAPILILDEPTAHLDALTEQRVWQNLAGFMAGRTTIIISHQAAARAHAHALVYLDGTQPLSPINAVPPTPA
jgi:ATP-binding cassette subfamily C protein CydC